MVEEFLAGRNEFDLYRNIASRNENLLINIMWSLLRNCKNDIKSERLRQSVLDEYIAKKYYNCLENYTKSLCLASYNGRQYALALANRSATYFAMKLYENCLIDINLSLQADYPNDKKPKLLFRKVKCLGEMRKLKEMVQEFNTCLAFITDSPNVSKSQQQNILKEMKSYVENVQIVTQAVPLRTFSFAVDQVIIESNAENTCASSALTFQRGNGSDTDVNILAARDIKRGEILIVEKAYVFGFHHEVPQEDGSGIFFCDFCSKEAKNCVPCKTCNHVVYCSEECRVASWNEYHQWECKIFRSHYVQPGLFLPLRLVIKAARDGSINEIINEPGDDITTPNLFLKLYMYAVNYEVLRQDYPDTFVKASDIVSLLVSALHDSKFFEFLMTTPYYSTYQNNLDSLDVLIGGALLKSTILAFQRSLVVDRFSPVSISLKDNKNMFKLSRMKMKTASAFCPIVSGLPHSCLTNTSISFQNDICTVKAFKNIKAGDIIYRTAYHETASTLFNNRKNDLRRLGITCKCEACENIKNNYENFDTLLCPICRGRSKPFQLARCAGRDRIVMDCVDCRVPVVMSPGIQEHFKDFNTWFQEDLSTRTLPATLEALTTFRTLIHPYHESNYELMKHLMVLYSKTTYSEKFLAASKNFKSCSEKRDSFNPYKYICTLGEICDSSFKFLRNNKGKLRKPEAEKMITYLSDVIKETEEMVSVQYPSLVNMFINANVYLLQFKVAYLLL